MNDVRQSALQEQPNGEHTLARRESVRGWLLYFCIVSIFISPLASMNAIGKDVNQWWFISYIALIIFSASAGLATLSRASSAFTFVGLDLTARLIYGFAQIGWALHLGSLHQSSVLIGGEIGRAIGTFFVVIIWYWYFKVSHRVKRTFGRNL